MLFYTGSFCLFIITFYNILLYRREIPDNIVLLAMCVCVIGMWVMVNQVRQDIRDKRNMDREEEIELVAMDVSMEKLIWREWSMVAMTWIRGQLYNAHIYTQKYRIFFMKSNNSRRYYNFHDKDIFCFKAMIVNVICSINDTFEQIFVNLIQYPLF